MKSDGKRLHTLAFGAAVAVAAPTIVLATPGIANAGPNFGLQVTWGKWQLGTGLPVTVTNKSPYGGHCTYDAIVVNTLLPPYHTEFDIAPWDGGQDPTVSWSIPGIPTGTTWKTVVSCSNNNGEWGHFEQTSSF